MALVIMLFPARVTPPHDVLSVRRPAQRLTPGRDLMAPTLRCRGGTLRWAACRTRRKSAVGRVSRASPGVPALRNCTRDEGGPFGFGNQVPISSHRKLLRAKAVVVSVAG